MSIILGFRPQIQFPQIYSTKVFASPALLSLDRRLRNAARSCVAGRFYILGVTLNPVHISPWLLFHSPVPRKVFLPPSVPRILEHPEFFWGSSLSSLCACDVGGTVPEGSSPPATDTLWSPELLLVGPSVYRGWEQDESSGFSWEFVTWASDGSLK